MTRTLSTACKRGTAVLAMLAGIATSAHAECWFDAGQRHNIDPLLLYSIAKVESSLNPSAINRNRNGTYDIGLMQINSTHLPRLSKAGITREKLLNDSCTSVMAGAQILSGFISRHGYTWEAVGAYNAGSAPHRREPTFKTSHSELADLPARAPSAASAQVANDVLFRAMALVGVLARAPGPAPAPCRAWRPDASARKTVARLRA